MAWFKRQTNAIHTATEDKKKETPDGYWYKTPSGVIVDHYDLNQNNFVITSAFIGGVFHSYITNFSGFANP